MSARTTDDVIRAAMIYQARVYLAQAAARRSQPGFHAVLLTWAASCRRRAIVARPQMELFA